MNRENVSDHVIESKLKFIDSQNLNEFILRIFLLKRFRNLPKYEFAMLSENEVGVLERTKFSTRNIKKRFTSYSLSSLSKTIKVVGVIVSLYPKSSRFAVLSRITATELQKRSGNWTRLRLEATNYRSENVQQSLLRRRWNLGISKSRIASLVPFDELFTDQILTHGQKHYANGIIQVNPFVLTSSDGAVQAQSQFIAGISHNLVPVLSMRGQNAVIHDVSNESKTIGHFTGLVANLTSRNPANYWHALIEICGKIALTDMDSRVAVEKIVVNKNFPSALLPFARYLFPNASLFLIQDGQYFTGDAVWNIPGRTILKDTPQDSLENVFVVDALLAGQLRKLAFDFCELIENERGKYSPMYKSVERFYIRRLSSARHLIGEEELLCELMKANVPIISLEDLDFYQQVNFFKSATRIGGVAGAGWANLIFCEANSRCGSFVGEFGYLWDMHQVLAKSVGVNYQQILVAQDFRNRRNDLLYYSESVHLPGILNTSAVVEMLNVIVN